MIYHHHTSGPPRRIQYMMLSISISMCLYVRKCVLLWTNSSLQTTLVDRCTQARVSHHWMQSQDPQLHEIYFFWMKERGIGEGKSPLVTPCSVNRYIETKRGHARTRTKSPIPPSHLICIPSFQYYLCIQES